MTLHEERLALARRISEQLLADYGDVIVAIGLHGSMAHGVSDERSDLDFAILTRAAEDLRGRDLFFGGVLLSLCTAGVNDYLSEAAQVDDAWAIESDQYMNVLVLHDPDDVFIRARDAHERAAERAEPDGFLDRARENVVGAIECLAKAERCLDLGSVVAAAVCLSDATRSLALSIGLLARIRWRGPHTAVQAASDVGRFVDGFSGAYAQATDESREVTSRMSATRAAVDALDRYLAGHGVTREVASLDRLLD